MLKSSSRAIESDVKTFFRKRGVIATNLGRSYRFQVDTRNGMRGIDLQDGIAELSRLITKYALCGVPLYIFPENLPDAQGVIQKDQPAEISVTKDDFDLTWELIK